MDACSSRTYLILSHLLDNTYRVHEQPGPARFLVTEVGVKHTFPKSGNAQILARRSECDYVNGRDLGPVDFRNVA